MAANLNSEFWRRINDLKIQLQSLYRIEGFQLNDEESHAKNIVKPKILSRDEVITKLEDVILTIVQDLSQEKPPSIKYNSRNSWKNTRFADNLLEFRKVYSVVLSCCFLPYRFNSAVGIEMIDNINKTEHRFDSMASVGKFAATLQIIAFCYRLLQQDTYATKRDIYYSDVPFFGNQGVVDSVVDNLACMLKVPRYCLHVLAASKGCIAGDLRYKEHDGTHVDCMDKISGTMVSSHVQGIYDMHSDAKFVLVVEKEASFQRLMDDNVLQKLNPCIVITGKGFPDVNTRMMVRCLWSTLQIPILALVDADPHGIEILSVYKFGSKALSFDAHSLTVPVIKWLGVLPSDINRLSIPRDKLIPLTDGDKCKARQLLERPYIKSQDAWLQEIDSMLSLGYKAEIQALSSISFDFLTVTYLPVKIKHGRWI
ncbi:meiotic recombination protein SPO11-like [Orbicella faveolata]|uniref:meiotic recombination protein SPO11-like n=1 Tax=Orbicella faveolata TaxID=48498 RepID=UPI0009E21263|nr:meiotic recombination protein SPO11-like [Orbicella faveolata]